MNKKTHLLLIFFLIIIPIFIPDSHMKLILKFIVCIILFII